MAGKSDLKKLRSNEPREKRQRGFSDTVALKSRKREVFC